MPNEVDYRTQRDDLVLAVGEFAFLEDENGRVFALVGPHRAPVSANEKVVKWNLTSRKFTPVSNFPEGIQSNAVAKENEYIVLHDPAQDDTKPHPNQGKTEAAPLKTGNTIVLNGPLNFPLWPAQTYELISAHLLNRNQYLVILVYDEVATAKNWDQSQHGVAPWIELPTPVVVSKTNDNDAPIDPPVQPVVEANSIANPVKGMEYIIRGSKQLSIFVPPTGVLVVKDDQGKYVRDAVSLELLEYCILVDEEGNKRFVRGPRIVFPSHSAERFVVEGGVKVFRALELGGKRMGIHVKALVAHTDETDREWQIGEEGFITGDQMPFFFPTEKMSVITYGNRTIHYAVVISAGQAKYVLDRNLGPINLILGPAMYLPNPVNEVFVQRVLTPEQASLWFPGNRAVQTYNARLRSSQDLEHSYLEANVAEENDVRSVAAEAFAANTVARSTQFTAPRTVTLEAKFDGAVKIEVWPGYSVYIQKADGSGEVVLGPTVRFLEFHETLLAMRLSTGRPKSDDSAFQTVYLRYANNRVSDIVDAETSDFVPIQLQLVFLVNFDLEQQEKWWTVEDYIKLLCDRMRSLIRSIVKQYTINEFMNGPAEIILDSVLGVEDEDDSSRPGYRFTENGMVVFQMEVSNVEIQDRQIGSMLILSRQSAVRSAIEIAEQTRQREFTEVIEGIKQAIARFVAETAAEKDRLALEGISRQGQIAVANVEADLELATSKQQLESAQQLIQDLANAANLARRLREEQQRQGFADADQVRHLTLLQAQTDAKVATIQAITPQDIAILRQIVDTNLLSNMTENMGSTALLRGTSIFEILQMLLNGTGLENIGKLLIERSATNNSDNS